MQQMELMKEKTKLEEQYLRIVCQLELLNYKQQSQNCDATAVMVNSLTKQNIKVKTIKNAIQCKNCNDIIESKNTHDFVSCTCGQTSVDGGHEYFKRVGDNYKEMSQHKYSILISQTIELAIKD